MLHPLSDMLHVIISDVFSPRREPSFTPMDSIRSAQGNKRRRAKPATKDRSKIKAARKQRHRHD